jgi:tRNA-uridine 2-sulfurtransferase
MSAQTTVVVAMSGGVDSSVAAALLVERGYNVIGMMLRLWSEPGTEDSNRCCTPDAMAQARRVAALLNIPFYAVDVQEHFYDVVVRPFLEGYSSGVTPNPCVLCNREVRWGFLYERAQAFGGDFFATGHYARVDRQPDGKARLLRGVDARKDQSYVLSVLDQVHLQKTLFPLGEYNKYEVREIASRFHLPVASRADSQDLCFLANQDYRGFLSRNAPETLRPGEITNSAGQVIGQHQGLAFYTIGQRKGLGIQSSEATYVIQKDLENNRLIVGTTNELGRQELAADDINWIGDKPLNNLPGVTAKIRYQAVEAPVVLMNINDRSAKVIFEHPMRDITPGQRVVFYLGDECLGGGTIHL